MIDEKFMRRAIEVAKQSGADIPIGAVLVRDGEILAAAHNEKELHQVASKHAEMIVLEEASKKLKRWRLEDCELYVTLEPCPMCAWAILQSRVKNVYFGSCDKLYGAMGTKINLQELSKAKINIKGGILEKECDDLLLEYFKTMRTKE